MEDHQQKQEKETDTLRLHRGSPRSRFQLRERLRERQRFIYDSFQGKPAPPYVSHERQIPYYVPPCDRASLSTISQSTLTREQGNAYCRQRDLVTKTRRMPTFSTSPSLRSSLFGLPLELRQHIYSYLLPWNEHHMFQTGLHGDIPNLGLKTAKQASNTTYSGPTHERLQAHTAIMCVNSQLYYEVREYLFHNSIIRILVDESGYSFLESDSGGPFPDAMRPQQGTKRYLSQNQNDILNYQCRDRFTNWHKFFMSNFDFTQPRKLVIRIQGPDYENPEGVVQIRESMMNLCDVLRKCPKIKAVEVEPQSQEYCCPDNADGNGTHGSYFVWEWENKIVPTSRPWFGRRKYRQIFNREAVWGGKLRHLLSQERSDLNLVLQPLKLLRNVVKPTVFLPPTADDITLLQARIQDICRYMSGPRPGLRLCNVSEQLALHQEITKQCRSRRCRYHIYGN